MQNWTTLALAVPEISLRPQNLKWVTWPWPLPFYGWFVIPVLGLDVVSVCTKFDYSSFSRSRDIVGAFQNLNGSSDLTMPLLGMICHPWLALTTINRSTQFELSISTDYRDMKGETKCRNWGRFGVVRVTQGHWKWRHSIERMWLWIHSFRR